MSKCQNCGVEFNPVNEQHRYCSGSCRVDAFHKRKMGVITPSITAYQTHSKTSVNTIVLSKDEYDDLQKRIIEAESWNDTNTELIYQHKENTNIALQTAEFWKAKYEELLKKNSEERLEQEKKHRQEMYNMKEELDGIKIADKITSIFGNLKR